MTSADRIHPALRYHLTNTLQWAELRPLQEAAVLPVIEGNDCLLVAPTASGKTEAAVFPLLSRMADESWRPLSVLYVCPLRALLNNLEPRLAGYASWLGRRATLWHGDTSESGRGAVQANPPDLLLTTPESLEGMLISARLDAHAFFANLRAVVVDEVHAFLGDDRGWHLLAVLERVTRLAGRPLQRVGLSATVGNQAEVLARLQGSNAGHRAAFVVDPPVEESAQPEVTLDYVGSLDNAAKVIAAIHLGEKRLVFCDSRRQVEQLAIALRSHGVQTFVSHSSLSAQERRRAEHTFAEASNCVIVATSTLELGIDIGDLDRVVQVDAPVTVSGFLQRMGRTGRRGGGRRNCLLLTTDNDALLQAAGLLRLWSAGWVEPVDLPQAPLHILAQQVLALVLQEGRIGRRTWREWLDGLPLADGAADVIVTHLLEGGFLAEDQDMLMMGAAGEGAFGRRNFIELTSVFAADPQFTVLHGRAEIGSVHPLALAARGGGPRLILLGGQSWEVTHVDWRRRRCHVRLSAAGGRAGWRGTPRLLHAPLCMAMRDVALGAESGVPLTRRGASQLDQVREEMAANAREGGTLLRRDASGRLRWWTWAGGAANASLAAALRDVVEDPPRLENLWLRLADGVGFDDLRSAIRFARGRAIPEPTVTEEAVRGLKFGDALPHALASHALAARLAEPATAVEILEEAGPVLVAG